MRSTQEEGKAVNPGGGEGVQLGGGARSTRWRGEQPREARSRALTRSARAAREKGGGTGRGRVLAGQLQSPTQGVGPAPAGRIVLAASAIRIGGASAAGTGRGATFGSGSDRGWRRGKRGQPQVSVRRAR